MTQHKQSHRIKSHGRTSHHIALHQSRSHHHHGTAEGSFTAKKWFGHRAGRSPCAHSIGKFFLCYIVLFSSEASAPGSSGNYWYLFYILYCYASYPLQFGGSPCVYSPDESIACCMLMTGLPRTELARIELTPAS